MLESKKHVLESSKRDFTIKDYYRKFFENGGVFHSSISLTFNEYYIELLSQASLIVDGANRADFYCCYSPQSEDLHNVNKLITVFLEDKEFQDLEEMIETLKVIRDGAIEMFELFLSNQSFFEKNWKHL